MSRIDASQPIQSSTPVGNNNELSDIDLNEFLNLMITELQNQDPLNPMENSEILQQMNTIREISSTDQLSETLAAVLTGQNLSTASNMIGKSVSALTDAGEDIEGVVDRVSVEVNDDDSSNRILRVHVGEHQIKVENVRGIASDEPA